MPIYHNCAQYSEKYDRLKLGLPTSSNFHKIITPQGAPSKQWYDYACVLIAERVLQRKIDFYRSPAMERGLIIEDEAVRWYELDRDVTTTPIGFVTTDDGKIGCTPDRLVGDDGLAEIKAPLPHTQVAYFLSGKISERFRPQLQGQLYVSGRQWVDIVAYHEAPLPKIVIRVEPDEEYQAALAKELDAFNVFIDSAMAKIRETNESMTRIRAEIRQMLKASLDAT